MSTIEVIINGVTQSVSKQQLFSMAAQGIINPQTPIMVNGKLATAGQVKGIVFLLEEESLEFIEGPGALVPTSHVTYGNNYGGAYNGSYSIPNPSPPVYPNAGPYGFPTPSMYSPSGYMQHPFPNAHPSRIGVAVTSLVLGILGLITWLLPIIGAPVSITGLVCGGIGLSGEGRGMSIAGIVLCIIGLILTVINFFLGMLIVLEEMGKL